MNSPMSAKASMSSKRSTISSCSMPRIRPLSMAFSRPVKSGLNPVPIPKIARDYAHKRTLPSPVAAHDAQRGAWLHVQVDVLQRPELVASFGLAEAQDLPQPRGPARGYPVLL